MAVFTVHTKVSFLKGKSYVIVDSRTNLPGDDEYTDKAYAGKIAAQMNRDLKKPLYIKESPGGSIYWVITLDNEIKATCKSYAEAERARDEL